MRKEQLGPVPRGRFGAGFASGMVTGVLVTVLALMLWARLAGPPRAVQSASSGQPVVVAPPVNAPAPETPPATAPAPPQPEIRSNPRPGAAPAPGSLPSAPETGSPQQEGLLLPVAGIPPTSVRDTFNDMRGSVPHEALDIMAPKGTPVIAAADGVIRKLFESRKGGYTIYQFSPDETLCYYYAHLDHYAPGLEEGQRVRRGDIIAFVGTSGNADAAGPHLHFAVTQLEADKKWWTGTPIDPYLMLEGVRNRQSGP